MAHLHVRDRRIEAKIAYVGALAAGKATNLRHFGAAPAVEGDARVVAEWRPSPPPGAGFEDVAVTVALVALRGAPEDEAVRALVEDADAIVFVADATPGSEGASRAALAVVRGALATRADLPVVVQVNKTDLADAVSPGELVAALDVAAWPHVSASARSGDGVVATAEAALTRIFARLDRCAVETNAGAPDGPPPGRGAATPLLAALRQVLRETVSEHVAALEARSGATELRQALLDEARQTRAAVEGLSSRVEGVERALGQLRAETERLFEQQDAALAAIGEVARATPSTLARMGEEIRGDVMRSVDAQAKADREHVTATALALKRAVDGVAADVRAIDPKLALGELRADVQAVAHQAHTLGEAVGPMGGALRALTPRLADIEASVQRELRAGASRAVSSMAERLDALRDETKEALGASEARETATHALVTELVEELQKPKKGWFG